MKKIRGMFFAAPTILVVTILYGIVSLLISLLQRKRSGVAQHRIAQSWARCLVRLSGVRVHVEGLEQIDPARSYVFIANHLSYSDTPVVLANIPMQFRFLAKSGLFQIPLLGTHLHRAGHIRVPLEDARGSVKTLQLAAETIQDEKISLLVFPEGGRSEDGLLQPFREGGAYIAIRAGVPVVPLVLIGTREVLPFGGAVITPGSVTLRVLKPMETDHMKLKDRTLLTQRLRQVIAAELNEADVAPEAIPVPPVQTPG